MNNRKKSVNLVVCVLLVLLFLSACGRYQAEVMFTPTTNSFGVNSYTSSPVASIGTVTVTTTPVIFRTATRTPGPTWTPSPTMPIWTTWTALPSVNEESSRQIAAGLTTDKECDLPCWWGITPGQTSRSEAMKILDDVALNLETSDLGDGTRLVKIHYMPMNGERYAYQMYTFIGNEVEVIEISPERTDGLILNQIIQSLGRPSDVVIEGATEIADGGIPFVIGIFYIDEGIFVHFYLNAIDSDEQLIICPQREYAGGILLFKPGIISQVRDVKNISYIYNFSREHFKSIGDVSELDIDSFTTAMSIASGDYCFLVSKAAMRE